MQYHDIIVIKSKYTYTHTYNKLFIKIYVLRYIFTNASTDMNGTRLFVWCPISYTLGYSFSFSKKNSSLLITKPIQIVTSFNSIVHFWSYISYAVISIKIQYIWYVSLFFIYIYIYISALICILQILRHALIVHSLELGLPLISSYTIIKF